MESNGGARLVRETSIRGGAVMLQWTVSKYCQHDEYWPEVVSFFRKSWMLNTIFVSCITLTLFLLLQLPEGVRDKLENDSCSTRLGLSCFDLVINMILFFVLLPCVFRFGTLPGYNMILYVVWVIVISLDLALIPIGYSWRKEALFAYFLTSCGVASVYVFLFFPTKVISWPNAAFMSSGVVVVLGLVSTLFLPMSFLWAVLAAFILVLGLLGYFRIILNHVTPREYILASLFLLFPEGLACLGSRGEQTEEDSETHSPLVES
mmetsp:Transcript_8320/g.13488  ORF Transcript_8320/g.13488 Transcript_8320/m.13488 type:complete len:263 (+) Transcript_8320:397-1185(+)